MGKTWKEYYELKLELQKCGFTEFYLHNHDSGLERPWQHLTSIEWSANGGARSVYFIAQVDLLTFRWNVDIYSWGSNGVELENGVMDLLKQIPPTHRPAFRKILLDIAAAIEKETIERYETPATQNRVAMASLRDIAGS